MRDVRTAWRNLRQYRSRLTALFVVTVLGSIACLTSLGLVSQAAAAAQSRVAEGTALRTIEVRSLPQRQDVKSLTTGNLAALSRIAHVTSVEPMLQASFGIKTQEIPGVLLYGTVVQDSHRPPILKSTRKQVFPLEAGEVVLPTVSQGNNLESLLGQRIRVDYTRQIAQGQGEAGYDDVRVVGLFDPSYGDDGPNTAYADQALVVKWAAAKAGVADLLSTVGYAQANVVVDTSADVPPVLERIRAAGYHAISLESRLSELPGALKMLRGFGYGVFVLLLVFCSCTGLALAGSFVRARTREIGLIKALGFSRGRILRIFLLEMALAGLIATTVGAVLGNLVSVSAMAALEGKELFGIPMPDTGGLPDPIWSLLLIATPALVLVTGALVPARRAAAMSPDAALRDW